MRMRPRSNLPEISYAPKHLRDIHRGLLRECNLILSSLRLVMPRGIFMKPVMDYYADATLKRTSLRIVDCLLAKINKYRILNEDMTSILSGHRRDS